MIDGYTIDRCTIDLSIVPVDGYTVAAVTIALSMVTLLTATFWTATMGMVNFAHRQFPTVAMLQC